MGNKTSTPADNMGTMSQSSMSTSVPRGRVVRSLDDLDTVYTVNGDGLSQHSDFMQGTTNPKYEPFYRMEQLWRDMTPSERRMVEHDHMANFF
jgi:hypothetical protein